MSVLLRCVRSFSGGYGERAAFFDAFPMTDKHALVIPREHVGSVYALPGAVQREIWDLVAAVRRMLADRYAVDSFNIGVNDGVAAGQTVAHAHVHVIPRRPGDVLDPRGGSVGLSLRAPRVSARPAFPAAPPRYRDTH